MSQLPELKSSTPSISEFDPTIIPFQYRVIEDIECNFDYSLGVHEIMLSGSIGSAKSLLMAHIAVRQCLNTPKSIGMLGRRSLTDLRDTILRKVIDHIEADLKEGVHYEFNKSTGRIIFYNGSELICRSWADRRYSKMRSLELSFACIEELTENSSEDFKEFYKEVVARVGRLPHIKKNFIICATNPDSPAHAAYDYFIASKLPTRHVYYSVTEQNPFLPKSYIEGLKNTFSPQEAKRMLFGEWVEIRTEFIYYSFDTSRNVIDRYEINYQYPILISYDFNIGVGKPMSACLSQYINSVFYFFDEVIIEGSNTLETCEEMIARGILDMPTKFIIRGDAAGRSKSSKYNRSDYDIIEKAFKNYEPKHGEKMLVEIDVPLSNPPIRKRHIIVNGQLFNYNEQVSVFITKNCETLIKGMRLAKLKKGGNYIEDDSDSYQHVTTALGYNILRELDNRESSTNFSQGSIHGTPKHTYKRREYLRS